MNYSDGTMPANTDRPLVAFLFFGVLGLISLYISYQAPELGLGRATGIAFLAWLTVLIYTIFNSKNGWLSPPVGYLLLLGLFHLGLFVPIALGLTPEQEESWMYSPSADKALTLCAAAFFFYGAFAARAKTVIHQDNSHETSKVNQQRDACAPLFYSGLALFSIGAISLYYGAYRLDLFSTHYGESYFLRSIQDPRLFGLGFLFSLMGTVIAASGAGHKHIKYVVAVSFLILSPFFFFGFRGHLVVYLMSALMVWHLKDRALAKKVALVFLVFIFFMAPAVKLLRTFEAENVSEALSQVSIFDIALEAGGSAKPLVETLDMVDYRGERYWYGRSYLMALERIVPNISMNWRESNPQSALPPAAWISQIVNPAAYRQGGGIGYSGVAEPYLNFGLIGVAIYFSLLGHLLMRLDYLTVHSMYLSAAVYCSYASLLWTVRNDFTNFVRPSVWTLLLVFGIYMIFARRPEDHQ